MTEELKRRGRLAAAFIAGPAVTVGMLGAGAAPVMAQDAADPDTTDETVEQEENPEGQDPSAEADESDADGEADEDTDGEEVGDEDSDGDDAEEDDADADDADADGSDGEGEEEEDDEVVDPADVEAPQTETEESQTFQTAEPLNTETTVEGSVVNFSDLPENANVTAEANGESMYVGSADADGNLSVDTVDSVGVLNLEPGENTITFTWTWLDEEFEDRTDSTDVTVTLDGPETGDVAFSVDGPVVTGEGFPEGVFSVSVEAPNGNSTTATMDEDGTVTLDVADRFDVLDLDYGEQALTFTWSWNDDVFGQQQDSAEVAVTAVPPLETGEDVDAEEIIAGLVGDDTGIEGIETIGQNVQVGQFSGWDGLGIPAGVVLSTGDLQQAWAAITGRGTGSASNDLEGAGDEDLDAIIDDNAQTQDAGGMEFSFVPEENYVRFSYVFASEEYGAATDYNDVFAFLVNGENYAVFESADGETLPVSIETINHATNPDFFNDNQADEDGETPHESNVAGFTTVMTFTAPVNAGELNTLKLVVGDTNDGVFDSMVFLQGGSFEQIQGPVTSGDEVTTEQGEAIGGEFALSTNIEDPEWTIDVTDGIDEEAGELEVDGTSWNFTPNDDFTGEVSFTFTANDGQLTTVPATITITVGEEDPADEDDEDEEGATEPEGGDDDEDADVDDDGAPAEEGPSAELTAESSEVAAGEELTLVGEGFEPGEDVEFSLNPELGTFAANDDGEVTAVVTIPEDTEPGDYTITATGLSSERSDSVDITVVEPAGAGAAGEVRDDDAAEDDAPAAKGPEAEVEDKAAAAGAKEAPDAADQGEELAATGMTGRDVGLASGLLLLIGGGLAALGYKNRLGRRDADA